MNILKSLFLATTTSILTFTSLLPTQATDYYVSTGGNDSSPGTSWDVPWRSIQRAVDAAAPGDTVNVAGGYYNETVIMDGSGTPDAPITLLGTGFLESGITVLVGNLYIGGTSLIVNGFIVSPPSVGWWAAAVSLEGTGNQLVNCTVVNYGATASDQATAISIGGSFNLVAGCTVHDLNDIDVFHIFGHDNTIDGCAVYNIQQLNYYVNHTDIFQTWDNGDEVYNIVIDSCTVTNCSCQFGSTQTSPAFRIHDWTFRNNVFANISLAFYSGIPRTLFYNNVFDRVGIELGYAVSLYGFDAYHDSNGDEFVNNVFLGSGQDIHIHDYGVADPSEQNNFYSYQGGSYNFANTAAFDYHPQPGSILNGAGANLSALFTQNKEGNGRQADGPWNVGPY